MRTHELGVLLTKKQSTHCLIIRKLLFHATLEEKSQSYIIAPSELANAGYINANLPHFRSSSVAQVAERQAHKPMIASSNPTSGAIFDVFLTVVLFM